MIKKRTPRDFKFIRLLGEGSYSSVYLATDANVTCPQVSPIASVNSTTYQQHDEHTIDIRKYAIKVCQKSHIKRQNKQVAIMREKEIMNVLNQCPNKHFIKLYCTFQDFERLFFVMSYANNGELLTYMIKNPLSTYMVRRFTLQLIEALEHMHKLNIVHRDLKPENILLDEHLNLLISDFGSAKIINGNSNHEQHESSVSKDNQNQTNAATIEIKSSDTSQSTSTVSIQCRLSAINIERRNSFVGTAQYVSPEMLTNRLASNKSDLWALGVIVFQMITNTMPFDAPNEYLIYKKIQSLDYKYPEHFDNDARQLCSSLLRIEPLERLGANDNLHIDGYKSLRQHPFLATTTTTTTITKTQDGEEEQTSNLNDNLKQIDLQSASGALQKTDLDLVNIDKILPGLDETQLLRLLTDG